MPDAPRPPAEGGIAMLLHIADYLDAGGGFGDGERQDIARELRDAVGLLTAPPVTAAERAALDSIQRRLNRVNEDGYTGTEALLILVNTDVPWLLNLARRAGAAATPRDHAGGEG